MPRARVRGVVQPLVCCLPQLQMQWLGHRCTAIVAEPTAPQARQCAQPAPYGSSARNESTLAPVWSSAHCCAHLIARCSMLSAFCVGGQIRGECCSEPCLVLLVGLSIEPCRVVPSTSCLLSTIRQWAIRYTSSLRRMSKWTTSHARRSKRRPLRRMHPFAHRDCTCTAPYLQLPVCRSVRE